MTDRIPDEIMREAREAFHEAIKGPAGDEISIIADALMARDQQAAEIARHVPTPADVQDHMLRLGYISASQAIAAAILSYDEAQK